MLTGNLTIPGSVKSIGDSAFYGCSKLTGPLTIPGSVESIGDYAFQDCSELTGNLVIPDSVTTIGESAFYGAESFKGLTFAGESFPAIGSNAFNFNTTSKEKRYDLKFQSNRPLPDTMKYDHTKFQCEIIWNFGEISYSQDCLYGTLPEYEGTVPAGNFFEWPAVEEVTGPKEYTVAYKEITVDFGEDNYYYTGSPVVPEVTVKIGSDILEKDTDYEISYSETYVGSAAVTITGIGKYGGTVEKGFEILKAKLTVTAEDKTVTFSEAAPEFTAKYEGFVNDENESVLGGTLEFDCGYDGSVYAETFDIIPNGLTSDNYNITFVKGTLTVSKAEIGIPTAVSGLTYNGAEQTGVPVGEGYTITGNTGINAGGYTATATLDDGYAWSDGSVDNKTIEWSIAKAILTAAYSGETVTYGDSPELNVTVTGFVNGETAETAAGYVAPTVINENTDAGTYTLVPAGGSALNYDFEYVSGTLTIEANAPAENTGVSLGAIAATVAVLAVAAAAVAFWLLRRK
jgi:hypothetical protein